MVPGSALRGFVAPTNVRTTSQVSSGPSSTIATTGPRLMKRDEIVVETLADVLLVVAGEGVGVEGPQVHGDDRQALELEPLDDLTDEAALDGVGLQQDEGAI